MDIIDILDIMDIMDIMDIIIIMDNIIIMDIIIITAWMAKAGAVSATVGLLLAHFLITAFQAILVEQGQMDTFQTLHR